MTCANTVRVPVPMSCEPLNAWTEPSPSTRTSHAVCLMHDVEPLRLRHADAALDRSRSDAGRRRSLPIEALRAERRFARRRIVGVFRIDAISKFDRIDAKAMRDLIHRLLEREDALHLSGPAKGGAGPGVREHVVVFGRDVRAGVQLL